MLTDSETLFCTDPRLPPSPPIHIHGCHRHRLTQLDSHERTDYEVVSQSGSSSSNKI